jgi:hypothetical protein
VRYANADTVYRRVDIDPEDPDNEPLIEELEALEEGIAAAIDDLCNRPHGFGRTALIETRDIAYPEHHSYYAIPRAFTVGEYVWLGDSSSIDSPAYVTPAAFRDVTAVVADGEELDLDDCTTVFTRLDGWSHGLRLPGYGYNTVLVTASWEDTTAEEVPPEIREAATFIVIDEWRLREMSPAGEIGPPGLATFLRNAWDFTLVKTAIKKHTFRELVV